MRRVILLFLASCDPASHGTSVDGPPGSGVDAPGGNAAADQLCVSETNRYRALRIRPAVTASAQLEAFANTGAMVDFGSSPDNHFSQTQGGGIAFVENECPQQ